MPKKWNYNTLKPAARELFKNAMRAKRPIMCRVDTHRYGFFVPRKDHENRTLYVMFGKVPGVRRDIKEIDFLNGYLIANLAPAES